MDDLLEDEVEEKFYVNSEAADGLITELIQSGRLEKKVSKTIRGGGRGSKDRHEWDLIRIKRQCRSVT